MRKTISALSDQHKMICVSLGIKRFQRDLELKITLTKKVGAYDLMKIKAVRRDKYKIFAPDAENS